jgi:hypothetical protein
MPKLAETLGTLPSGKVVELGQDALFRYLRDNYIKNSEEAARIAIAKQRLDFYHDRAESVFEKDLESLFKNSRVLQWRKDLLPFSQYQNITKRIVDERSAVYSEKATRTISGANEGYQDFQRVLRMDRRMRRLNQRVNLLNDVLLLFRIRDDKVAVLDIVTPDRFWAIAHPNDPTWFVGAIIEQIPRGKPHETEPHYRVIAETDTFRLDKVGRIIPETYEEHGLGRLPLILVHSDERDDGLLDGYTGRDLTSAHRAIVLLNVLMMKAQKSGTRMAVATGDTSGMARDQPMDEEGVAEAPEGVALSSLDLRADPANYIEAARSVIKQIASNYSIPESVFDLSYQATSGFEIKLKRSALAEVRRDQILDYRNVEQELAGLQSLVLTKGNHEAAFNADGWKIDFGDTEPPEEPIARLTYWEKLQKMGLANMYEMFMWMNPEATEKDAMATVDANLDLWLEKVRLFQQESASYVAPPGAMARKPTNGENRSGALREQETEEAPE